MDKLLEDYKAYYRTRSKRYAGHPHFGRLASAEKALADAMEQCTDLSGQNSEIKKLAELTAVAETVDIATYRHQVYTQLKETVRAKGNRELMDHYQANPDTEPMSIVRANTEIMINNVKEVGEDITIVDHFMDLVRRLEVIEWYQYGEALPEWESKMRKIAEELRAKYIDHKQWFLDETRKYYPSYDFRWHLLWEERHRRLIPFPDGVIAERITVLKAKQPWH